LEKRKKGRKKVGTNRVQTVGGIIKAGTGSLHRPRSWMGGIELAPTDTTHLESRRGEKDP